MIRNPEAVSSSAPALPPYGDGPVPTAESLRMESARLCLNTSEIARETQYSRQRVWKVLYGGETSEPVRRAVWKALSEAGGEVASPASTL